jgi:hypothetical protein
MMSPRAGAAEPVQAITIRLPEDVYEDLRKEAFDKRTSINALIVEAVKSRKK